MDRKLTIAEHIDILIEKYKYSISYQDLQKNDKIIADTYITSIRQALRNLPFQFLIILIQELE